MEKLNQYLNTLILVCCLRQMEICKQIYQYWGMWLRKLCILYWKNLLQLFDSVVAPVAVYGCEIWGFMNTDRLEKLHLRYCKMVLKVKKSTNTCMVYGELGRLPLQFNIDSRMLCFWYRIVTSKTTNFQLLFINWWINYTVWEFIHVNG